MIHEIFPHRFNNHYLAGQTLGENDFIFHYQGNSLLFKVNGDNYQIPRRNDFIEITDKTESTFLFTLDDVSCFLVWGNLTVKEPLVYKEISFFRDIPSKEVAWAFIAGFHLMNWYAQNKFCGACGTKTHHKPDERALICPACNAMFFPKISPAIIVAITCNDKILLARNANFRANWYSLIAGYADIGETLEHTVAREVKEEVGLDVKNIRYYKSQPWPLSGSMMIGFIAEADENQPICIDGNEITEAAWFTRENLPNHPPSAISIAGELIEMFERGEL